MNSNLKESTQEIDLTHFFGKVGGLFGKLKALLFDLLKGIIKNLKMILLLIILGLSAGFFLEQAEPVYKHEIVVVPNFESNRFLYDKIESLKFKGDSPILSVKIEPIMNVYQFVSSGDNLKVAEYLSEKNVPLTSYKRGNQTELIYKYHLITIYTKIKDTDGSIVDNFIDSFNHEAYFLERQKVSLETIKKQIEESEVTINNINKMFEKMGTSQEGLSKELNIEVHSQTDDLLKTKNVLLNQISWLKVNLIEHSQIIYPTFKVLNVEQTKQMQHFILLPLTFVLVFFGFKQLLKLYKKFA